MTTRPGKKQKRESLAALYAGKGAGNEEAPVDDAPQSRPKASAGGLPGIVLDKISAQHGELVHLDTGDIEDLFPPDRLTMAFSDEAFASLKESIRANGQDQPILVRPKPGHQGKYQIAFGRRRRTACTELEIRIKAIVADLTDDQMLQVMIRENDERSAVSTYERSVFYKDLMKSEQIGVRELARRLDVSPAMVSRLTNLIVLPDVLLEVLGDPRPLGIRLLERLGEMVSAQDKLNRALHAWSGVKPAETPGERAQQLLKLAAEAEMSPAQKQHYELLGSQGPIGRVIWKGDRCRLEFDKGLGDDRIKRFLDMLTEADV